MDQKTVESNRPTSAQTERLQAAADAPARRVQQTITVVLNLAPGQTPYDLIERHHRLEEYNALHHFFEDIGYQVVSQSIKLEERE